MGIVKKGLKAIGLIQDPPKVAPPPDPNAERVKAEEERRKKATERRRKLSQEGHQSTFNTSAFGLQSDANVKKRTLLGG